MGVLDKIRIRTRLLRESNIISHNCVGARVYQRRNMMYGNPFVWCIISPRDFRYLYENYDKIDFGNIETVKEDIYYKIVIDNKITVYYTHYRYDAEAETPEKRSDVDVYYNRMGEYVTERYRERLSRMRERPFFIVTDREFSLRPSFNFTRDDLLGYVGKEDCLVITADETVTGKNVFHVPGRQLDPKEMVDMIFS